MPNTKKDPHYLDHRKRLREKFKKSHQSLYEYELLEIILGYCVIRKDTKKMAKDLFEKNDKSLLAIMANAEFLTGLTDYQKTFFMLIHEYYKRACAEQISQKPCISSVKDLNDYLRIRFLGIKKEQVLAIYLNVKCAIISIEVLSEGTVDSATIYTREIVKKAIENHATAIVLAHNHPSGDYKPSPEDYRTTERVATALNTIGVQLLDHLVVGFNTSYSIMQRQVIKN